MTQEYTKEQLLKMLSERDADLEKRDVIIEESKAKIAKLEDMVAWLQRKVFGKMSEKFIPEDPNVRQLELFGDELSQEEEVILEPKEKDDDRYTYIDFEESKKLAFIPGELYVKKIIRKKYALKKEIQGTEETETLPSVTIAPLPNYAISKCLADSSLLSEIIQSDGYQAYHQFESLDQKLMLGCWAHARREFERALDENKELATQALLQIQELYKIEREADDNHLDYDQRKELRTEKAYPILCRFEKWLMDNYSKVLQKSRTGKAIAYTYSLFPKLSRYHLDGRYRIDNNLVENSVRPLAIGRKNYMFCGNDEAASRAAIMYSLIGSCKAIDVNPHKWLSYVLDNISDCKDITSLLPENFI